MLKLPPGLWCRNGVFYMRDQSGGGDCGKSLKTKDKAVALTTYYRRKAGVQPQSEPDKTPVGEAGTRWVDSYVVAHRRNEKDVRLARLRVEKYLVGFFGQTTINQLSAEKFQLYKGWLKKQGLKPRTVNHLLSDARCLCGWLEENGLVKRSPFPRRLFNTPGEINAPAPVAFTPEELDVLVKLEDPHGFVIRLALATALRWADLCKLRVLNLDDRGDLVVTMNKTGKVVRIPVAPQLLWEIRAREDRLVPFSAKSPGSFARVVREKSGVASFHTRKLRHTFATLWRTNDGSPDVLTYLMGHASKKTTEIYGQTIEPYVRSEARRIGGW